MFAYCGNNPVNRMDPTGTFWKEIGTFFAKTWNNVKKWAKNTFGEEHTVSNTVSKKIIPEPSPIVITSGSTTTTMMYEYSSTIQWDTDITNTTFTNVSISAVGVVMAYALATGYYAPALQK